MSSIRQAPTAHADRAWMRTMLPGVMALGLGLAACAQPQPPAATPTPPPATTPGVADLVDARASSGETAMQSRGYTVARQAGLTAFWWNDGVRSCVRTVTANGRYSVVEPVAAANCGR